MHKLSIIILVSLLFTAFSCADETEESNNDNNGGCPDCPPWSDWYMAPRLTAGRLVTASGEALSWGDNREGRLADTSLFSSYIPLHVEDAPSFESLTIHGGTLSVLGISPDGSVYQWGSVSDARTTPNHTPVLWELDFPVKTIACDYDVCAAITPDGTLMAQGFDTIPGTDTFTRLTADATFQSVTVGEGHLCALDTAGRTWCAGDNHFGQSAPGDDATAIPLLTLVPHAPLFESLYTRSVFTCGITSEGALHCWGSGDLFSEDQPSDPVPSLSAMRFNAVCLWPDIVGALSTGGLYLSDYDNAEREVLTSHNFVEVHCDYMGWCARSDEGRLFCGGEDRTLWGTGAEDDGRASVDEAVEVYGSHTFSQVAVGAMNGASDCIDPHHFACALDDAGEVWCWGDNGLGTLGSAITTSSTELLPVAPELDAVAASPWYVLDAEGDLWFTKSTLENDRITAKATLLSSGHGFERLGHPSDYYGGHCAIDNQGVPWCWRYCLEGIVNGPDDSTCTPQPVTLPGRAVMTASLLGKSCAVMEGGEIFCWDYLTYGSNFTLACDMGLHCKISEPYALGTLTGPATFITSGADSFIVLYSDGSVHTLHDSGDLGDLPPPQDYVLPDGFSTVQVVKTANSLIGLNDAGELVVWRTPADQLPMENAPAHVVQVTAMSDTSDDYCALDTSENVWCGTVDEPMELIFTP